MFHKTLSHNSHLLVLNDSLLLKDGLKIGNIATSKFMPRYRYIHRVKGEFQLCMWQYENTYSDITC